jgi:hypothetical protein
MKIPSWTQIRILIVLVGIFMIYETFDMCDKGHETMRSVNREHDAVRSHVGDTVFVKKDTLVITDVDLWTYQYILDDGRKISVAYIIKE